MWRAPCGCPAAGLAVVLGTAGDRTDEAIHAMGAMAAAAADRLVVARRVKYQRGREPGEMEAIWRAGAAEAGVVQVDEIRRRAIRSEHELLDADPPLPDGSVVAVCALEQREEMVAEIQRRGGGRDCRRPRSPRGWAPAKDPFEGRYRRDMPAGRQPGRRPAAPARERRRRGRRPHRRGESGRRFEPAVMDASLRTGNLPVDRSRDSPFGQVTHQDGRRTVRRVGHRLKAGGTAQ